VIAATTGLDGGAAVAVVLVVLGAATTWTLLRRRFSREGLVGKPGAGGEDGAA
jgi:hypothetical protein